MGVVCRRRCGQPQIAIQTLQRMREGDILVFADAGCAFRGSKSGFRHFLTYLDTASLPLLCYKMEHIEHTWTKADTLRAMSANTSRIAATGQIVGGIWYLKKTEKTVRLMHEWRDWMARDNYTLIDDSPSRSQNHPSFQGHRHDQSVFSILVKQTGVHCRADDTWPLDTSNAPIVPVRCKRGHCRGLGSSSCMFLGLLTCLIVCALRWRVWGNRLSLG